VFVFGHLLGSYWFVSTDAYDIDFTTAQCVLALRLIGFAWDYYDGSRKIGKEDGKTVGNEINPKYEKDQILNRIVTLPPILEFYGFNYFFPAFLSGPQFTFRRYQRFFTGELFKGKDGKPAAIPDSTSATLRCLFLGLLYLAAQEVGKIWFSPSLLASPEFLNREMPFFFESYFNIYCGKISFDEIFGSLVTK